MASKVNDALDLWKKKVIKDVDEGYIKSYMSDSRNYFTQAKSDIDGLTWESATNTDKINSRKASGTDLLNRSNKIRIYLNVHKDSIDKDTYNSWMAQLDADKKNYSDIAGLFDSAYDDYSQYEGQQHYDIYHMSFDELQAKIDSSAKAPSQAEMQVAENRSKTVNGRSRNPQASSKRTATEGRSREYQVEKKPDSKIAYTTKSGQNITWQDLYDQKLDAQTFNADYTEYSSRANWNEFSEELSDPYLLDSDWQLMYSITANNVPYRLDDAKKQGYTEVQWKRAKDKRDYIARKYNLDLSDKEQTNVILGEKMKALESQKGELDTFEHIDMLTDEERRVLNYIANLQGRKAALQWFNKRKHIYDERARTDMAQRYQGIGKEHPLFGSVLSLGSNLAAGGEALVDGASYLFTGEMDHNESALITNSLRSGAMQAVDWEIGNWDAYDFLYSTGMSMADSVVSRAFGPTGGAISQGLGAAGHATNNALDRGMSSQQAFWTGVAAGTAEAVFEKYSISNFDALKEVPAYTLKDYAKNIGKSMLTNASEETLTEIANITYDALMNGDFSQWDTTYRQYLANGYSNEEALGKTFGDNFWQVTEAGFSGALMGFGFGAVGSAGSIVDTARANRQYNRQTRAIAERTAGNDANVNAMLDTADGLYSGATGRAKNNLEKRIGKVRDNATAKNVQKLYKSMDAATKAQNRADIVSSLKSKGISNTQAGRIADTIIAMSERNAITENNLGIISDEVIDVVYGGDLSKRDRSDLEAKGVPNAIEAVVNEFINNDGSTVRQRSSKLGALQRTIDTNHLKKAVVEDLVKNGIEPERAAKLAEVAVEDIVSQQESAMEAIPAGQTEGRWEQVQSAEGQVLYEDQPVQVAKVKSVEGGKLLVELADGAAVDASQLSFPSQGEQLLYQVVGKIADSADTAEQLLAGQQAGEASAQIYARAIEQAYVYGRHQIPLQQLVKESPYVRALTPQQRQKAYDLGKEAGAKSADQDQNQVNDTYNKAKTVLGNQQEKAPRTYTVRAAEGVRVKKFSPQQKAAYQLMQNIAPAVKGNMVAYEGGKEWGYYNHTTDEIYINVNATWSKANMMAFTLGHELAHRAKAGSPKQFKAFADFLMEQYGKQGASANDMIIEQITAAEREGRQMTTEEAFEEVVADACQRMLLDTDAGKKLAQWGAQSSPNKGFLAKLKQIINDLIDRLHRYFKGVDPDSMAAREFAKIDANAKQILADMFVDMSIDAGEKLSTIHAAGMGIKNTALQDGYKYKEPITKSDIDILVKIGRKSINQFSEQELGLTEKWARNFWDELNVKSPFFRRWFGDWRAASTAPAEIVAFAYGETGKINTKSRYVVNRDMNMRRVLVDDTVIQDSIHYAKEHGDEKQIRKLLGKVDEILEKGILLDTQISGKKTANKKGTTQFMHYLYTPISINGAPFIAKLSVEEYDLTGKARAYNLQRIELSTLSRAQFSQMIAENRGKYAYSADALSIAQLFDFVKQKDKNFQPKPASKVVNEDGTPKILYHGTYAEWTVYDLTKNVNQMWGEGIYLTPDPKRAALYGDRVMEFYVKADTDYRTAKRTGIQRDYTVMKNGDVLVYSPEQIKSATDNIGTFDGTNPDIRYKTPVAEDLSPRELLLNTVEGMVANSDEYRELQKYRRKIQELNETEKHLERLNEQLRQLYFAEGGRDYEMINKLEGQRAEALTKLNRYDSQLINLENTKPIRDIVNRMKQAAYQKGFQKAKDYYKQKSDAREEKLKQHYQESRRNAVERHDKAQIRQQIRKDVQRLDSLLNKGNKQKNVKQELQAFAGAALRTAQGTFLNNYNEYDMIRNGVHNRLMNEHQPIFDRCRELLTELDKLREEIYAEPGPDNIHDKWDPEAALRREDREEELKKELAKNMAILRNANVFRTENEGLQSSTAEELMNELLNAYSALQNSELAHVRGVFSQVIYDQIDGVRKFLAGKAVKDMTTVELKELQKMYRLVLHTISTSNELFAQKRKGDVRKLGEEVIRQLQDPGKDMSPEILDCLKKMGWANLKPETALELIGSDTLTEMMQGLYRGEDTYALDIDHARKFAKEQGEKYGRKSWDMERAIPFAGTKITLGQAMSLYAYTKRQQAQGHLEGDGFTHASNVRIKKAPDNLPLKLKYIMNATKTHVVSKEMYAKVADLLTPQQRKYVDAMQEYLSKTMGAKGNEVSRVLYGIDLFNEQAYFPLKTASEYHDEALGATTGEVKLKNISFTKEPEKNASNPIVLDDFESVWSAHVDKMSLYHGFVLPMEDFDRVYNYHQTVERDVTDAEGEVYKTELVNTKETVKVDIENKCGKAANAYIEQFMQQLNGNTQRDSSVEKFFRPWVSKFRKAAVLGSLSVAIQQPTAFIRAMAYLDIQDIADWKNWLGKTGKPDGKLVEEMYKYAPVALMKKIGGFDPNLGKTSREYMLGSKRTVLSALENALGMLPEKMDEWTWTYIWLCTKRQIRRQHPDLRVGSKEFCEKAGKLFSKIIRDTQVYDSVLVKSKVMRDKSVYIQGMTSFMNEPMTSMDMYIRSTLQAKQGKISKAKVARTYAAVIGSQILCAALASFVYAARDDDEDESYWEKYLSSFIGKTKEGILPWYSIPFVKDIFSIFKGYDVERSDMSIIADIYQGWNKLQSDNEDIGPWERYEAFAGSILNLFGIPLKNVSRDVRGIYNTIDHMINPRTTATKAGLRYAAKAGLTGKETPKAEQMYNAIVDNDAAHILRLMATYNTEDSAQAAVCTAVKDSYVSGKITEERALDILQIYGGVDQTDAQEKVMYYEFQKQHLEIYTEYCSMKKGYTKKSDIMRVIDSLDLTDAQKDALYYGAGYAESTIDEAPWH